MKRGFALACGTVLLATLYCRGVAAKPAPEAAPLVTAQLAWEPGAPGANKRRPIAFTATASEGVQQPSDVATPRHAKLKVAGANHIAITLDPNEEQPRLFVDTNLDGDLSKEKALRLQRRGKVWRGRRTVLVKHADERDAMALPIEFVFNPGSTDEALSARCLMYRRGSAVLGGRLRFIAIVDGNHDGCFDDAEQDRVFVDLTGDGRLQVGGRFTERVAVGEPARIGNEGWSAKVNSASGRSVTFTRTKKVPPPAKRSWQDVSVPRAGVARRPVKAPLRELKARFEEERDGTFTERVATVREIGSKGTKAAFEFLTTVAASDRDVQVRMHALLALGNPAFVAFGAEKVAAFARKARGGQADAIGQALQAMGHPDRQAIYRDMLASSDPYAVGFGARGLAWVGSDKDHDAIIEVVEEHNVPAARTLAYIHGARKLPGGPPLALMRKASQDRFAQLAAFAVQDLDRLGQKGARKRARELTKVRPVAPVGSVLAEVLGASIDAADIAALLSCLEDRKAPSSLRQAIAKQLGMLREPKAVAVIVKSLKHKVPAVRAVSAEILGHVHTHAVLQALLKRAKSEKEDPVLARVLAALGSHGDESAVPILLKRAKIKKMPRAKAAARQALAQFGFVHPKVAEFLVAMLEDGDVRDRAAALDAAAVSQKPELIERVVPRLADEAWQVRLAAVQALEQLRDKACVAPLIGRLKDEPSARLREAISWALYRLTGQRLYDNASVWAKWWADNEATFEIPKVMPTLPDPHVGGTQAGFFGIPIRSDRVVFVIDQSGSMAEPGGPPPDEASDPPERLDVATRQVLQATSRLPDAAQVNVVMFHNGVTLWKDKLQALKKKTRKTLDRFLAGQNPGGGTNLYDGLARALTMPDVDTVFLLSDGVPSAGRYLTTSAILQAVQRVNKTRRIAIHCVSIGMDSELLRRLAQENGGRYVQR